MRTEKIKKLIRRNWRLYVLMLPALAWVIVFAYTPMYGLLIAFKDYNAKLGILGSPFAEPVFKHFMSFFKTSIAANVIKNTVVLSLLTILISFPVPVIFALLLNQIKKGKRRKVIQTISYAPYFVSNVVVVSIISVICAPSGFINIILQHFTGGAPVYLTSRPEYFRMLYIISNIWQTMGFNAIVYIAALSGISQDYYEAAIMDGATKFQRIRYIDIPLIWPTVIIMLILSVGNIMSIGYEKVYLMQSGTNTSVSEIISTYVYKTGLQNAQFSFATAVGMFNAVVNFTVLLIVNRVAKRTTDISII